MNIASLPLSWTVEWNHCFGFGVLLVMVSWALSAVAPLRLPGLPFLGVLAFACLPFIASGAWFVSTRAVKDDGKPGGWLNGFNITAGAMLAAVFVVIPLTKMIDKLV